MKLPVVLRAEAELEFDRAFDWYDSQRIGLGEEFADRIQSILDHVASNPLRYRIVMNDVRKAVVRKFPFCIYFRYLIDRIDVLAVFHAKRNPKIWLRRI